MLSKMVTKLVHVTKNGIKMLIKWYQNDSTKMLPKIVITCYQKW